MQGRCACTARAGTNETYSIVLMTALAKVKASR